MIDTDTIEELKIIAQDGGRLSERDKQMIAQAVTQLEAMDKLLFNANQALTGANKALAEGKRAMQDANDLLQKTQHWPRPVYTRVNLTIGITTP